MELTVGLVVLLGSGSLGLLVATRGSQRLIGGLLVGHGLTIAALLIQPTLPLTTDAALILDQLGQGAWAFLFVWLALIAYLLPGGRFSSPYWRRWVQLLLIGVLLFLVGASGDAKMFAESHGSRVAPLPWTDHPVTRVFGVLGLLSLVLLVFGSFVALGRQLRRAEGDERRRLLWPVWGALSVPLALLFGWVNHFLLGGNPAPFLVALALAALALPATIAVAVLRHRLFDIEVVLTRTLSYALLMMLVVSAYAAVLVSAGTAVGDVSASGMLSVAVLAVVVHPVYARLRKQVERVVYGDRSDPAEALRRLGADAGSRDVHHLLESLGDSVADALDAEEAWVEPPGPSGVADARITKAPLRYQGENLGSLVVRLPAGRTMSAVERALLDDLALHASVMVKASLLAEALQESRSQIVSAREEERKRLRRDLHDGVGPSLAAIVLKLGAVQARQDPEQRSALLDEIRVEAQGTIQEIRRLVDDLRPPAIDEVGLVEAIRQRAAALSTDSLTCVVTGPARLPALPAAVEVAAYRVASEAMTNSVRHSGGSRCTVQIELNGMLGVTVSDNGRGAPERSVPGLGWTSMTQRAAELGGSCTITSRANRGLVLRAVLPGPEAQHASVQRITR